MTRFICLWVLLCGGMAFGATVYVDNLKGNDGNDGSQDKPVASVEHGLKLLKKSDTLEIINTGKPYQRPYPGEKGRGLTISHGGTLEAPMIINGNGAVLTGLAVIPVDKWTKVEDDIYSLPFWPMSNMYKGYKQQNYWLDGTQIWWVDGKAATNCKTMEELKETPGGFWWNKAKKAVLFHLPPAKTLEQLKIELPANYGFYITADHTIVKDVYFIHSWNDGFDAAGKNQNGVYKNCIAIDNCGQGFSCHDTSNVYYEDCVAIRCASSGSCDVHWCNTRYHRCIFMNNTFEAGIYANDAGTHLYSDCLVTGNGPFEQIWQRNNSSLTFDNCVILGTADKNILTMQDGTVAFKNCTIMNAAGLFSADAKYHSNLVMDNCLVSGFGQYILNLPESAEKNVILHGNLFADAPGLQIGDKMYNRTNWNEARPFFPKRTTEWLPEDQKIQGYTTDIKLNNRYGRPSRVGALLPNSVWERYEKMKTVKASPSGISFE